MRLNCSARNIREDFGIPENEYDNRYRVTRMSSGTTDIIYEYMNGALSKVKTYAENDNGTAYEEYNHTYDVFGNQLSVSVGNMPLSTNTYAPNNGKLTSSTYGNRVTVNYFYDHLDRVVKKMLQ